MKRMRALTRREFISTTAVAAGATLVPGMIRKAEARAAAAGNSTKLGAVALKAQPFPLRDDRMGPGLFAQAMEAYQKYLDFLPADRMLYSFRVTAGLGSSAEPVGGWEKPDCELRGHFTGGHILTALALMHASTGEKTFKAKGDAMVAEFAKCQKALGGGNLGAYPTELYDRRRDGCKVWAPFYTLHKFTAGHLDMYTHCGNDQALKVAEKMARWVSDWTRPQRRARRHVGRFVQLARRDR